MQMSLQIEEDVRNKARLTLQAHFYELEEKVYLEQPEYFKRKGDESKVYL